MLSRRHATKRPITKDDEAQIARFIAERGVTLCPTVALAPTTAEIKPRLLGEP